MNRYDDEFDDEMQDDRFMDQGGWNRGGWNRRPRNQGNRPREPEDGLGKVKVKLPTFEGKCDPDLYMDWEKKMEQVWTCHNFLELGRFS